MRDVARAFEPELQARCESFDHQHSAHQETPPARGARDEHGTDLAQLGQNLDQDPKAGTCLFALSFLNARLLSQLVLH